MKLYLQQSLSLSNQIKRKLNKSSHLSASEDGNVLKSCLPVIAEAWGLDSCQLETTSELIDYEGG